MIKRVIKTKSLGSVYLTASLLLIALLASAQEPETSPVDEMVATKPGAINEQVQSLKDDVLSLNRDLFILEEELLYPANTQVAVFVSLDVGDFFNLDSVELKIDGKEVAHYLYTDRERGALQRGGVQRLYTGNLKTGEHELVAFFTGQGPHERDYRRGTQLKFTKELGTKYLELRIRDKESRLQPEFDVRQWE